MVLMTCCTPFKHSFTGLLQVGKRISPRQEPRSWRKGIYCKSLVIYRDQMLCCIILTNENLVFKLFLKMIKLITLFFFLQFKEISFAYEVLSNPEKKETYDRFGLQGLKEGGGGSGIE